MAAVGKDNDIQKAMWFATGAAITAVATAYQTYQSNKRAADERQFQIKHMAIKAKTEEEKQLREHTAKIRLEAYENFLQSLTRFAGANFNDERSADFITAYFSIRLLTEGPVEEVCTKIYNKVIEVRKPEAKGDLRDGILNDLGNLVREVTNLMRIDLGRSGVRIQGLDSIPLRSTESSGTSLHTTEAHAEDDVKEIV